MRAVILGCFLPCVFLVATCVPWSEPPSKNLTSFRQNDEGEHTVSIGIFMNTYPTVVDGEFFPLELYTDEIEESGENFRGFAADVITGKDPLTGFDDDKSPEAIENARKRGHDDPHYFDAYYLKIMVVNDAIEELPMSVYLSRGFFPLNFHCPDNVESVKITADDSALGTPSSNNLPSDNFIARTARQVTFCRVKEVSGPYAGKYLYYTRVSLFDEDSYYVDELLDERDEWQRFTDILPQFHEVIVARAEFKYKGNEHIFSEGATILNLTYNVKPKVLEMQEILSQNSTANLAGIEDSTDRVQGYIHTTRSLEHDPQWQVLLMAQRKWLAIRLIMEAMPEQHNRKAKELRMSILESLELTDVREMGFMTAKLPEYSTAEDYLYDLRTRPANTVAAPHAVFFGDRNSRKHFNEIIYHLAISSAVRQWVGMRKLYDWVHIDKHPIYSCDRSCLAVDRQYMRNLIEQANTNSGSVTATTQYDLHSTFMSYINAINKVYPENHTAPAVFNKKYVVAGNAVNYDNSSDAYKDAYQSYSRRYDLVFSEPHGLLLGTNTFRKQVGGKRSPTDVRISSQGGDLQYEWKLHPNVHISTVDSAIREMFTGIYQQMEQLHKLKRESYRHDPDSKKQVKVTADFTDQFQILPLAKAMLIRPDYAYFMNDIFAKYTRLRPDVIGKWVFGAITVVAGIAVLALTIPSLGALAPIGAGLFLTGIGAVAGLTSSTLQFQHNRVLLKRIESSLFADNLGTNFEELQKAKKEYASSTRDLYITGALTVVEAAVFIRTGWHVFKAARGIRTLQKIQAISSAPQQYKNTLKYLKWCSSVYCRNLIRSIPLVTKVDEGAEFTRLLQGLNRASNVEEFKELVKTTWYANYKLFKPLVQRDFISDIIKTRVIPFSKTRKLPFAPSKVLGITKARMARLEQLMDKNALKNLYSQSESRPHELLNIFEEITYGRRKEKRFFFWSRKQKDLLSEHLGLTPVNFKKLRENDNELKILREKLKNAGLFGKGRKEIKQQIKERIQIITKNLKGGDFPPDKWDELKHLEMVEVNENRVKLLKGEWDNMIASIATYSRKDKKLVLNSKVIDDMADSRKWKDILARSGVNIDDYKDEMKGNFEIAVNNLNNLFEKSYEYYLKNLTSI